MKDRSVIDTASVGDRLILQREENKFDEKAIQVLNEKKQKLGMCRRRIMLFFQAYGCREAADCKDRKQGAEGNVYSDQNEYLSC